MAQIEIFVPFGGIQCEASGVYTSANVPSTCNAVQLTRGVRITDENGNDTRLRGCRVLITNNGEPTPTTQLSNVPFIWLENQPPIRFIVGASYQFLDSGMVTYGKMVAL